MTLADQFSEALAKRDWYLVIILAVFIVIWTPFKLLFMLLGAAFYIRRTIKEEDQGSSKVEARIATRELMAEITTPELKSAEDIFVKLIEIADPTPSAEIIKALADFFNEFYDVEELAKVPKAPPSCSPDSIEAIRYRDAMRLHIVRFRDPLDIQAHYMYVFDDIVKTLMKYVPASHRLGDEDEKPAQFTVPLHTLTTDPKLITELCEVCNLDKSVELHLFLKIRKRIEDNKKLIEDKKLKLSTFEETMEAYLKGTPFLPLLKAKVPITIPHATWNNHAIMAAPAGHGKTMALGAIIHGFLEEENPPAIIVIEPHNDLINKIQHLDIFNPENGRLRDRLVVIDPTDKPGFNFLDVGDADPATIDENFKYLMSALSSEMTTKQITAAVYILKLLQKMPNATIETLRQVTEESAKSIDKSAFAFAIAQLDPYAQDFFRKQFYSTNMSETRQQVAQRLYTVLANDLFRTMFTSPKNTFSIYDAIQAKKVVLINTSRDVLKKDGSALFGRWMLTQITAAGFRRPKNSPLCLLVLDEAHQYFDDSTETILSELRKFGIGLCAATQFLDQIPERTKSAIYGNTAIKMSGPVSHKDATSLAHEMYCTGDFIRSCRSHHRSHTEFALYTKDLETAVKVTIPFGVLENAPKMTAEEHKALRQRNRERYGTSSSANVNHDHENRLSQTHEAPAKKPSNEVPPLQPTTVSTTTPPPTPTPATDPHAGIDD